MSDFPRTDKKIELSIAANDDLDMICTIGRALSVPDRVKILKSLLGKSKSITMLSEELGIPVTSVSRHLDVLSEAQLVFISYQPSPKGHIKFCTAMVLGCAVSMEPGTKVDDANPEYSAELPVGLFSYCNIKSPCGMAGKKGPIGVFDDPSIFFEKERTDAECIWFDSGFISYNFPVSPLKHHPCSEISFSFEICSETMYYNNKWPSDITIYINDREVTTFTSPGDFGGRRGKYTPDYWPVISTQYGLLKKITVSRRGVFVDDAFVHDSPIFDDLNLDNGSAVKITFGIKEDAKHRGGLNLFGKNFGDYPQAIVMTVK